MNINPENTLSPSLGLSIQDTKHNPIKCTTSIRCLRIAKEIFSLTTAFVGGAAITSVSLYTASIGVLGGAAILACALVILGINYMFEKAIKKEQQRRQIEAFCHLLIDRVRACILHNSQYNQKSNILELLESIRTKQYFVESGSDDIRVKFVGSQGAIEHVLACSQALQELENLTGAIHTPLPATPVCTRVNSDFLRNLLDPSIAHDLDKLLTVKSRAEIIREYLEKNGNLYIIYPKGGLEKRSQQEQAIYQEELQRYPGRLFDCAIDCLEMDPDFIGATYLFRDKYKNLYTFSIKARQANDIQKQSEWGIWLGSISDPVVKERINVVFDYIKNNKGPDLRKKYEELSA